MKFRFFIVILLILNMIGCKSYYISKKLKDVDETSKKFINEDRNLRNNLSEGTEIQILFSAPKEIPSSYNQLKTVFYDNLKTHFGNLKISTSDNYYLAIEGKDYFYEFNEKIGKEIRIFKDKRFNEYIDIYKCKKYIILAKNKENKKILFFPLIVDIELDIHDTGSYNDIRNFDLFLRCDVVDSSTKNKIIDNRVFGNIRFDSSGRKNLYQPYVLASLINQLAEASKVFTKIIRE